MDAVPMSIAGPISAALCGGICFMFAKMLEQHREATTTWNAERERLLKIIENQNIRVDRLTKTVGALVTSFFFAPDDIKEPIRQSIREINDEERRRHDA